MVSESEGVFRRGAVRKAAHDFCLCWFELREAEATAAFLAQDVEFIGTGEGEYANGKAALERYIGEDIRQMPEPFRMDIEPICERALSDTLESLSVRLDLKNSLYHWRLRGFFILEEQGGCWRVKSLHFAEPSDKQSGGEHYPQTLMLQREAQIRQELLNDSIAGGMMGGYMEEGFPFYFINGRMLDYLGYADEAEFVKDIGGKINNCMHPDDRRAVDEEVAAQLAARDEYVVEYRMKKKDGSYIWVHDLGRKTIAEDGRAAIVSACIDITAQKRAQEEVLRLYNNIPGAVLRCKPDDDLSVIDANDGLFECIGYSREEFAAMGNRLVGLIEPSDLPNVLQALSAQPQGETIHLELRLRCKNGGVRWISLKAQPLFEDGERYDYCVFVDITKEKKLRERVRELYDKELTYFAELSPSDGNIQGILNISQNVLESYVATSDAAVASVGDSYDYTISRLAASAYESSMGEHILCTLDREKVLEDYAGGDVDYQFEFLRRKNDGRVFWDKTNLRSCQNPETGDVIFFFYTSDVTEQKLSARLLQKITSLDYDFIILLDLKTDMYNMFTYQDGSPDMPPPQGKFRSETEKIAERFILDEFKSEYFSNIQSDNIKKNLQKQDSYSFVVGMKNDKGEIRTRRFQVFCISRELMRVGITRTDVTDIVRREQRQKEELSAALIAAEQANAAKSDFLSRMSHEIRTPMNAIIGMSAIAAQSLGNEERVAECISKIGISSRFLLSLINDILDMSRIESGKMLLKNEKIPTEEFLTGVNSICYSQAAAKDVDFECIVDPVLDDIYMGDAMKLQQVLINILSNAVKFTPAGGKVSFSVEQRRRNKRHAVLRFVVNDTGVGMSEEYLPHIFEPFSQESTGTTSAYGGTGLGLAISKNIVDMMDGQISVRSIKGIGTEFTVDVKLGVCEEELKRHAQKHEQPQFSRLKTLVVDDDVAVCESAVVTLKEMGVTAEWVDGGRKAVERVQEMRAAGKYFDMILIDWKMPEMDGIETARRIRAVAGEDVTIIIVTAYDWVAIEQEARLAGVNLLMSKPLFRSSLVSAFTRALGEKEEGKEEERADYDFHGRRVLLVEDHPLNVEVATILLEDKGFFVETANNGLRALEMFSKAETGYYDAVLMDIRMPVMDGLTAAKNIRQMSNADAKTVPIIAMTANAFEDDMEKSKAAGMDAHLAKPIDPEKLYRTLYDFIVEKE